MTKSNQLDALGNRSEIPNHPDKNVLEKVNTPKTDFDYSIRLTCPEFTSIATKASVGLITRYPPDLSLTSGSNILIISLSASCFAKIGVLFL